MTSRIYCRCSSALCMLEPRGLRLVMRHVSLISKLGKHFLEESESADFFELATDVAPFPVGDLAGLRFVCVLVIEVADSYFGRR